MLLFAAAALAVSPQPEAAHAYVGPTVQARATIRIISGARLSFGDPESSQGPPPRETLLRTDGGSQPAKLIEFE